MSTSQPKRGSGWLKWTIGIATVRPWTEALRNGKFPKPTHDKTIRPNGSNVTCLTTEDGTVRQSLLQLGNARAGDLGAVEDEPLQVGQPLEVHQSRVGDLGVDESEHPLPFLAMVSEIGARVSTKCRPMRQNTR